MSDLFHESIPDEWIDQIFAVMELSGQHIFQVLTKRSSRMREYLSSPYLPDRLLLAIKALAQEFPDAFCDWMLSSPGAMEQYHNNLAGDAKIVATKAILRLPLRHVWLGVSCEDQQRADERIPDLEATPAAVRFISAEPLLGPISLKGVTRLDWVIVGGESGNNARPMHPQWARDLRDQCQAAGVAFHFKQWGEWGPFPHEAEMTVGQRYPADMATGCVRWGKKKSGHLLDGKEWRQFPA